MTTEASRTLPKRHTSLGWAVVEVGFENVPGYDLEEAKRGLSPQAIRTELYRDWEASSNKAVYPEFSREMHVSKYSLPYDPERLIYVGLDMPGTPGAVVEQIDAFNRLCVLSSLSPPEEETVGYYEFGETLAELLLRKYAEPHGRSLDELPLKFYGDPAGQVALPKPGQSPKEARSCFDILRHGIRLHKGYDEWGREVIEEKPGWGWNVLPGDVSLVKRVETVRALLTSLVRGPEGPVPALVIDPDCRTVIEGFAGKYGYRQRTEGRYELDPEKNFWSHTMDALAYPVTRLFARTIKEPRDEDRRRHRPGSGASARHTRMG